MTAITIGWTRYYDNDGELLPQLPPDFLPFLDGYRAGLPQHVETIHVDLGDEEDVTAASVAEAAYDATNAPYDLDGLAGRIRAAIEATGYRGQDAHYSLSVGDTVTVGETMLSCERMGWAEVPSFGRSLS